MQDPSSTSPLLHNGPHSDDHEALLSDEYKPFLQQEPKQEHLSLDHMFDKIGFGYYQVRLILMLGMVAAAEGAQIIVVMLSLTILQNQWKYSEDIQSFVISLNFIGFVVGGAVSGFYADKYGRLKPMLVSLALINVFNVASGFAGDIALFGLLRFLVGLFLGFFAPLGFTMVVENMPKEHRGKLVIIATSFMFVGQLFACFLAFLVLTDLVNGDWRALVFWSTVLLVVALVVNLIYLDESVRYQLVMGEYEKAFKLLNKIIKFNRVETYTEMSESDKEGLREWARELAEEVPDEEVASISALFKGEYKVVTCIVWFGYFINSFIYFGILLMLPYVLQRVSDSGNIEPTVVANPDDLPSIALSVLVESFSVIVAALFVDTKSVGRKKLLIIFYFLTALACGGGTVYISRGIFVAWITIAKILVNVCSYYFYLFTVEIYPTKYRATGMGLATAVGKLSTVFMPWISYRLTDIYILAPFGLFAGLACLAGLVTFKLKIDTRGIDLK